LKVEKVVIPAAGVGTRLLTATKEVPKEMLPLFSLDPSGILVLKPALQIIFEQLYDVGFREFCFIVGRGKRAIEDHFSKNYGLLQFLRSKGKTRLALLLEEFYAKLDDSTIVFVNQPEPKGFGDAVLRAERFVNGEPFLLHAGDDIVFSNDEEHIKSLINGFFKFKADATLLIEEVPDPTKYGVVEVEQHGEGVLKVLKLVEKPKVPPTNLAVIAIYVLSPIIFDALREVKPDNTGEVQLADAIQKLIVDGYLVLAVRLKGKRIDLGTPESYFKALDLTYRLSNERSRRGPSYEW